MRLHHLTWGKEPVYLFGITTPSATKLSACSHYSRCFFEAAQQIETIPASRSPQTKIEPSAVT
jgi:hypothetical protein